MQWWCGPFEALTTDRLYDVLALREAVFVVEQDCAYLDADGKDRVALHLLGCDDEGLCAYLRILPPGVSHEDVAIGRVVTAPRVRGQGWGRPLMQAGLDHAAQHFGPASVFVSAQAHLKDFYASLGFDVCGEGYLEDGIPHLPMRTGPRG